MRLVISVSLFMLVISVISGCYRMSRQESSCTYPQMPLPQGAHVIAQGTDSQDVNIVMFDINDSQENVLTFYKHLLLQNGWRVAMENTEEGDIVYNVSGDLSEDTCLIDILTSRPANGLTRVIINQGDRPR
jgi:hypothetical protein